MVEELAQSCTVVNIDVRCLRSPTWALRPIDPQVVSELTRSIQGLGLLQPIVARKCKGAYEVVFGNHRLEACKRLGITNVPALVASYSEQEAFLVRVSENLVRNSYMDPVEEARGYRELVRMGWTIDAIGCKIGKSDSYVCERLSLLDRLDGEVRGRASGGKISTSHLELLSKVGDRVKQRQLAELIEKRKISVRTLESLINGIPPPQTITVDEDLGECSIRIPSQLAKVANIHPGQRVRVSIRGRKIILENPTLSGRRNRMNNFRSGVYPRTENNRPGNDTN